MRGAFKHVTLVWHVASARRKWTGDGTPATCLFFQPPISGRQSPDIPHISHRLMMERGAHMQLLTAALESVHGRAGLLAKTLVSSESQVAILRAR